MDDIKVSVIGVDGKVRWLETRQAKQFVEERGGQYILNPKEKYYPQFDQAHALAKKREDFKNDDGIERATVEKDILGVIIV